MAPPVVQPAAPPVVELAVQTTDHPADEPAVQRPGLEPLAPQPAAYAVESAEGVTVQPRAALVQPAGQQAWQTASAGPPRPARELAWELAVGEPFGEPEAEESNVEPALQRTLAARPVLRDPPAVEDGAPRAPTPRSAGPEPAVRADSLQRRSPRAPRVTSVDRAGAQPAAARASPSPKPRAPRWALERELLQRRKSLILRSTSERLSSLHTPTDLAELCFPP